MKDLYTRATAVAVPLVRGVTDDQLDGPTPCTEYTVAGLLNHLFQVVVEFQKLARFEAPDFAYQPDFLHDDWRERFAAETRALTDAWSQPGAAEGDTSPMGFPRPIVARLPVFDLAVHGWDLAAATGQPYRDDDTLLTELHQMALGFADRARQAGQFGEPVAVPADAPRIDRLVGLVGRDPAWKP